MLAPAKCQFVPFKFPDGALFEEFGERYLAPCPTLLEYWTYNFASMSECYCADLFFRNFFYGNQHLKDGDHFKLHLRENV